MKVALTLFSFIPNSDGGMLARISSIAILIALAATGLAAPGRALAQCRLCSVPTTTPDTGATDAKPIRMEVAASLDFDRLIMTGPGSGQAILRPDGTRQSLGALGGLSGRAVVAEVVIHGEPGRAVRVDLPRTIDLYGLKGGSIRIESLFSDLPDFPALDAAGLLRVRIGGDLRVTGDVDGDFRGDVPVLVDYL